MRSKPIQVCILITLLASTTTIAQKKYSSNPLFDGWYADPDAIILQNKLYIYPTFSSRYNNQVFFDAFSSTDLVNWKKHPRILDTSAIKWARRAMWAPCLVQKGDKYFLFFSANDIQSAARKNWNGKAPDAVDDTVGGIGIAVSDRPEGPFKDYLGKPLINLFYNNAQPIDQAVFKDKDGQYYILYGGWGRCNIAKLNDDFTALVPMEDGKPVKEITPKGYVEGPVMFIKNNKYYLMWSEGNWTDSSYKVAYAISDSVTGPFIKKATILTADPSVATGAGHHSVINLPGTADWYIVYHRRPIPNEDRDHRVVCMDRLFFNRDGTIKELKMTKKGVKKRKIRRS
jgi:beta-xylosidase